MDSPWKEPEEHPHQRTPDEMRALLLQIQGLMQQIADRKEQIVRKALLGTCPLKGCACGVRTARWMVEIGGPPPWVERLVLMCDAGHEWYDKNEANVDGTQIRLTSTRSTVPFEAALFRVLESAIEESLGHTLFECTCGEDEAEARGEVTLPHKSDCPKGMG